MHVLYDRADPDANEFIIEVFDDERNLVRRERFTHEEVLQTVEDLAVAIEGEEGERQN